MSLVRSRPAETEDFVGDYSHSHDWYLRTHTVFHICDLALLDYA